jgi:serine/threonine protein kinase
MAQKFERFKEIKEIGQGAFGKTILVEDLTDNNRRVVIKLPLKEETENALIDELISNAHLKASLEKMAHPNIVKYLGHAKYQGHTVMIMEYVKGTNLRRIVGPAEHKRPPLDLSLALRVTADVCSGLAAAHKAHIYHSDIKPDNIMVCEDSGVAKLCDFGISEIMRTTSATNGGGTIAYMSPEALSGKASFQADIWSLSATLYEMVTGRLPFEFPPGNFIQALEVFKKKVRTEDPVPPKKLNPKIDDRLNGLILRGLEKGLKDRFEKAQDMLTALEAHQRGEDYIDIEIAKGSDLIKEKKEAEAEILLKNVLQRFPTKAEAYLLLGEIYTRGLQPAQTEGVLRKGVAQCPAHAVLHFNLAMVLNTLKKRAEAIGVLERAIQLDLGRLKRHAEILLGNLKAGRG